MNEEILTVKEVAEYLKLNPITIYRWANKGDIPSFKVGGEWRFKRDSIEDWIKLHENGNGWDKKAEKPRDIVLIK